MQTLFRPLPYLSFRKALLLRLLMVPNLFLNRATGLENLPQSGSAIYVFNHNNALESLLVPVFLMFHLGGRTVSFVIDWMYGKIPVLGWLMRLTDPLYVYHKRSTIPLIERRRPALPSPGVVERCCRRLEEGGSIGIFPEGKRNPHPERLARAKPGIGHIVLQSGKPVIPVGIDFPVRRQKGRIPVFGRMVLTVGTPLSFSEWSERYTACNARNGSYGESRRQQHDLADATTRTLMRKLSELCGKSFGEPESPVSGLCVFNHTISKKELPCPV